MKCVRCGAHESLPALFRLPDEWRIVCSTFRTPSGVVFVWRQGRVNAIYCKSCSATLRICWRCGCTDERGCPQGCHWVEKDLCSACARPQESPDLGLADLGAVELAKLATRPPVAFDVSPLTLFCVIGHIQLALRHPQADGPSGEHVRTFLAAARAAIAVPGSALDTIIRMGDGPARDRQKEPA